MDEVTVPSGHAVKNGLSDAADSWMDEVTVHSGHAVKNGLSIYI